MSPTRSIQVYCTPLFHRPKVTSSCKKKNLRSFFFTSFQSIYSISLLVLFVKQYVTKEIGDIFQISPNLHTLDDSFVQDIYGDTLQLLRFRYCLSSMICLLLSRTFCLVILACMMQIRERYCFDDFFFFYFYFFVEKGGTCKRWLVWFLRTHWLISKDQMHRLNSNFRIIHFDFQCRWCIFDWTIVTTIFMSSHYTRALWWLQ